LKTAFSQDVSRRARLARRVCRRLRRSGRWRVDDNPTGVRAGMSAATRKKSSYPSDWQTALKRDCASLQPTVWEYFFVTLL